MITDPIGLYVHVPFCKSKCAYCDFLSFPACTEKYEEDYVDALIREISSYKGEERIRVDTVFFGGGTPTLLSKDSFSRIAEAIYKTFQIMPNTEFTLEANPKTVLSESLAAYKEYGVNRISLGLQSSHKNELKKLGRIHNFDEFLASYELCRNAGIENINVDLMYGIVDQTLSSFEKTLCRVAALSCEHISVYGLILESGTPLYNMRDKLTFPTEDEECDMYYLAADLLRSYGYLHYEISNYAKSGYECRHNLKYWRDAEYIGLGLAAHSYYGNKRFSNPESFSEYFAPDMPNYRTETVITKEDNAYEYAMMRLRLREGFSLNDYRERFSVSFTEGKEGYIENLIGGGFLKIENGRISLTEKGFYVSNTILSELI